MARLVFFLVFVVSVRAATAPDSIAGKVYREASFFVRGTTEKTIVFGADGRCVYLKRANGGVLNLAFPGKTFLNAPVSDGAYVYRRTGEADASVDLRLDDGTTETLSLHFTTDNGGDFGSLTWVLSDVAAAMAAPANNVSMRGRVSPGQPLIVGFVVPGTGKGDPGAFVPPPDAQQREVLVRAVGPSLAAFGVADRWADPDFQLFRGSSVAVTNQVVYHDWGMRPGGNNGSQAFPDTPDAGAEAAFRKIFASPLVGAFPLVAGSKDAAGVFRLAPGAYTIVCQPPAGDAGGEVLIEVYFLP